MTNVVVYHNPNCGTSRNVLALIRNAGVEPTIIEYLKTPPSRAELVDMIDKAGLKVREAIRVKGTPFHELGLDDLALSDETLLDAMLQHPILINRPFVLTPWGVRLCRPSEVVLDILPLPQKGPFRKEDGEHVIEFNRQPCALVVRVGVVSNTVNTAAGPSLRSLPARVSSGQPSCERQVRGGIFQPQDYHAKNLPKVVLDFT